MIEEFMIKELIIKNFKCFADERFDIKPLTIFTGINSTGKSSLIQAMALCYHARNPSFLQAFTQEHGNTELLHRKANPDKDMIELSTPPDPTILRLSSENDGFLSPSVLGNLFNSKSSHFHQIRSDRWGGIALMEKKEGPLKDVGELGAYSADYLSRYESQPIDPQRQHKHAQGDTLRHNVEAWLGEISPSARFDYNAIPKTGKMRLEINASRPANVGFGLSYSLGMIAMLLYTPQATILCIENPEAHLHPRAQTKMGELIARSAASGTQVIVETHSDHLIDGIRIAVKKEHLLAEDSSVYFFEPEEEDICIHHPLLDAQGRFDHWPDSFFDQFLRNGKELL